MNDPHLYLIMRGDMPSMGAGKLAAQAAHGASMFHETARDFKSHTSNIEFSSKINPDHWFWGYENWIRQASNFGTTIVLTATRDEIVSIENNLSFDAAKSGFKTEYLHDTIVDPTYPFTMETEIFNYLNNIGKTEIFNYLNNIGETTEIFENVSDLGNGRTFATREETTGVWVFGSKEALFPYIGHLKLYP